MPRTNQETLFFYDLETSGFNPSQDRIMQFAGQRTDMDLNPIDEPHNYYISLSPDVLPDPQALLVTGITPGQTLESGLSEAQFLKIFTEQIALPNTVFIGFNSVRFDDEFTRHIHFRNFYDPYEWAWKEGRSRWDVLDLVRMTRALRPEGIKWPVDENGQPINRLVQLAEINKIEHESAHDALSDVVATIGLARLINKRQPRLFEYLLKMRNKTDVTELVERVIPFVYTSGKYENEYEKTTVAVMLAKHPTDQAALVFDLRYNPADYETLSPEEIVELWSWRNDKADEERKKLPIKTLKYNRCPAIAPLSVLDDSSVSRLGLDMTVVQRHYDALSGSKLSSTVLEAIKIMDKKRELKPRPDDLDIDNTMYDGFISNQDKERALIVRQSSPSQLKELEIKFSDWRLNSLMPLYKGRNFPETLTSEERKVWDNYRAGKIHGVDGKSDKLADYLYRIDELLKDKNLTPEAKQILNRLKDHARTLA